MTSLAVIMSLCLDEICECNDHECRDERVCSQAFQSDNRLVLISRHIGSNRSLLTVEQTPLSIRNWATFHKLNPHLLGWQYTEQMNWRTFGWL
jgi:hypothetical protein